MDNGCRPVGGARHIAGHHGGGVVLPWHRQWMGGDSHGLDRRRQLRQLSAVPERGCQRRPALQDRQIRQLAAELPGGRLCGQCQHPLPDQHQRRQPGDHRHGGRQLHLVRLRQDMAATAGAWHLQRLGQRAHAAGGRSPVAGRGLSGWQDQPAPQVRSGGGLGDQLRRQQRRWGAGARRRRHLLERDRHCPLPGQ
ncbi:hypothetical protein D3C85_567870 [compost metagenome]